MRKDSRQIALTVLERITQHGEMPDEIIDESLGTGKVIEKRDRSLIHKIVFGVLRWQGRIDYIIRSFSKRKIDKIDRTILNILRIGMYQIVYLNRIPDAAAVNSSVEMAKATAKPWASGYVNAVLRRASREYNAVIYPEKYNDPVGYICAEKSMPGWLIIRWIKKYGMNETEALCDRINTIPDITIRINTLKTDMEKLERGLKNEVDEIGHTKYCPFGLYFSKPNKPIAQLVPFKRGWFQVQDEAAQLVSMILNPTPNEIVMDACAGRGGKTGHIAQLMDNKGKIEAIDVDKRKLDILEMEMKRLGFENVDTVEADISHPLDKNEYGKFDRILLDAPCTGLGVLQRNPDAKWRNNKKDFEYYHKKQVTLLNNISLLIKPSGIIVYAVCSMEQEETDDVIKEFLNNHSDFTIDKNSGQLDGKAALLMDENGFFRTIPHHHYMDGFFAVRLKKIR